MYGNVSRKAYSDLIIYSGVLAELTTYIPKTKVRKEHNLLSSEEVAEEEDPEEVSFI